MTRAQNNAMIREKGERVGISLSGHSREIRGPKGTVASGHWIRSRESPIADEHCWNGLTVVF